MTSEPERLQPTESLVGPPGKLASLLVSLNPVPAFRAGLPASRGRAQVLGNLAQLGASAPSTFASKLLPRATVRMDGEEQPKDAEEASEGETAERKRVLSGVQPTGVLHLGNYLGAIRQWVVNQELYDNYFCVVDLHATTAPHVPKELTKDTYRTAALYIACGIDPKKSKVFVQSHVKGHAELQWLLNCVTPMNWLERMIQYKEKAQKQEADRVSVGLFDYPVLMAADILLYQSQLVPVGEDQRQHLELTRDISRRFNDMYCKNKKRKTFTEPNALILKSNARVMSLQDGTNKMSKSAENDNSRINLLDPPDVIRRKIKKCKTDMVMGISYDESRPECINLLGIYEAMTGKTREEVEVEIKDLNGWGDFKPLLADAIVAHLEPIQKRYNELISEPGYLQGVLTEGMEAADELATRTVDSTKRAMGFTLPGDTKLPKL